jgi:inosose dehydratase
METTNRRKFFKTAAMASLGIAGLSRVDFATANVHSSNQQSFEIGIATYGLRKLSVYQLIEAMRTMQLSKMSIKSMHLPMDASEEEIKTRIAMFKDAGLEPYACGVVYMKSKDDVDNAFRYAKAAGFKVMVSVPNYELLDYVEEKVKAHDIMIAIHNHGPDGLPYPTPQDVLERVKNRDKKMGICMDVAHVARAGEDPVIAIKESADRLYDVHLRDNSAPAKEGNCVRPGKGTLDIPAIMKTLKEINYQGVYCIEYSTEANNPVPGNLETAGYLRGVYNAQTNM